MKRALEVVNELKQKGLILDYAIGGAIGALRWVEPFFTRDLDVFIILAKQSKNNELVVLTPIYDYLAEHDYKEWIGQWIMIDGVPVEFIPAIGLSKEAVEQAISIDFQGINSKVMTPEYLIALFLSAGRDKDITKIRLLLEQASVDHKRLNGILKKYNLVEKFDRLTNIKR